VPARGEYSGKKKFQRRDLEENISIQKCGEHNVFGEKAIRGGIEEGRKREQRKKATLLPQATEEQTSTVSKEGSQGGGERTNVGDSVTLGTGNHDYTKKDIRRQEEKRLTGGSQTIRVS